MALTGKQRRALRALGHHLSTVVQVGKEGVSETLVSATEQALADHELIKVKVLESSPADRHEAADELAERTDSEVAQVLGRTVLLYRRHPKKPKIALPGAPALPKEPVAEAAAVSKRPSSKRRPRVTKRQARDTSSRRR